MTTIFESTVTCAVCGTESTVTGIGSTNEMGYRDLDLRPAQMMRSTIWGWVKECYACGYCAADLEVAEPGARVIVESAAFVDFRDSLADLSGLARAFRTASFIAAERLDHKQAFHYTLCEAWVHDDAGDGVRATAARLNAVDFLNLVHLDGGSLFGEDGGDAAIAADLLRRAGAFDRAAELCTQALAEACDDYVRKILELELEHSRRHDAERHTMEEVPE